MSCRTDTLTREVVGFVATNITARTGDMIRYQLALILSLAMLPLGVSAQERRSDDHRGTLQQQRACRSDVVRHCRNMQDQDDQAIAECLKAHMRQLSPDCRRVLEEGR